MDGRRTKRSWTVGLLATVACVSALAASRLPPPECLRILREARIAQEVGDAEGAFDLFTRAVDEYPEEILPVQELLSRRAFLRLTPERVAELRASLAGRLNDPSYALNAGSVHYLVTAAGTDDPELLEAVLAGVAVRGEPFASDPTVLRATATAQGRLDRHGESRATLERLMAVEPSYAVVHRALRLDLDLERWEDALALIERHLGDPELGPTLRPFYLELLARTGRREEMLKELGRMRSPAYSTLLSSIGYLQLMKRAAWSLYDSGEREEVERIWRLILEQDPDDLEARQVVAHLFSSQEERAAHLAEVDRELAEVVGTDELLDLGTEFLAAGDDGRAYELLARIPSGYRSEAAWFNLALAALHLERWEEAAEGFREAISRNPERPQSHHHLATALQALDRCAEAVPAFERGLELEPDRLSSWYWLAKCHEAAGNAGAAARALAEYRRRKGDG